METTEIQKNQPNPLMLINLALEKGLDVDKLTALFELQQRWEKKESEKDFNAAFANFQRECPEIKKNKKADYPTKTGGRLSYSFADLAQICKQIKEPLAKNGLSYRWEFKEVGALIECTCIISHLSGFSKTSQLAAPKDESGQKNIIQQIGSTHSYLQRYSLIGALGISTADGDNDGKNHGPAQPKQKEVLPEEKKRQEAKLTLWKKEFESLKTPTEIKLNSKDILEKAEKDGAPMDDLKKFVHELYASKKADVKKAELKISGTKETVQLP